MTVVYALYGVAALLALAPIAIAIGASPRGNSVVYGASLIVTLTLCVLALLSLFEYSDRVSTAALPLGLPWLGAHFRIDALAAFFLVVVNLGGAAASLFALGYGRHEHSPQRVLLGLPWLGAHFRLDALASFFLVVVNLGGASRQASMVSATATTTRRRTACFPSSPAFLAGMNLVVLADDAFSYLLCWEFMSLASWALVMAHHREPGNAKAGLRLSRDGKLRHAGACCWPSACWRDPREIMDLPPFAPASTRPTWPGWF